MTLAQELTYYDEELSLRGKYFYPEGRSEKSLPIVMVVHAWDGLTEEVEDKCVDLTKAGVIAFAIDIYGEGRVSTDHNELPELVMPFIKDRDLYLRRMQLAFEAAGTIEGGDSSRIAAIGFCFGGMGALDLARSGVAMAAAVSFHGGLSAPNAKSDEGEELAIGAKVLVLHGHDDPLVPAQELRDFEQEMTAKNADWQLISYGHTLHAFTRPDANSPELGAQYHPMVAKRAWQSMLNLLREVFYEQ